VAVSRHDATPLTSEELVHHPRGRGPLQPPPVDGTCRDAGRL